MSPQPLWPPRPLPVPLSVPQGAVPPVGALRCRSRPLPLAGSRRGRGSWQPWTRPAWTQVFGAAARGRMSLGLVFFSAFQVRPKSRDGNVLEFGFFSSLGLTQLSWGLGT